MTFFLILITKRMSFSEKHAHVLYLPSMSADVGADILDLAETMITSSSLQYEPVSEASNPCGCVIFSYFFPTTAFLLSACFVRPSLNWLRNRDYGKGKLPSLYCLQLPLLGLLRVKFQLEGLEDEAVFLGLSAKKQTCKHTEEGTLQPRNFVSHSFEVMWWSWKSDSDTLSFSFPSPISISPWRTQVCLVCLFTPQDAGPHSEPSERGARSSGSPVQNAPQRGSHRSAATVSSADFCLAQTKRQICNSNNS